ncbi:hypothetical protein EJ04DRAFT_530376 [Polyplosphaeria fusca]|uniref:CENP-V/GFA domain-containing protein n=1 Tax=Polyplosphaeria fusca TaxID=682080 RepID=A0A9P4V7U5_9PLEO|nr:hypothetical protein EJ04DRAFT_530376 [Polyplosphaeria fusca]
MSTFNPNRKPYHGSCHCGKTRYICHLELPLRVVHPEAPYDTTRIRKCNCTTCIKTGMFSVRFAYAPDDFVLLSPKDPLEELSNYKCSDMVTNWVFCPTCGVRCIAFAGPKTETVEIDLETWLGKESAGKTTTTVWKMKDQDWDETKGDYFTVNATTLDVGQEGLDLREWHEKGWIVYLDCLDYKEDNRHGRPHRGGQY